MMNADTDFKIIPPKGMKYDLARQLVQDDVFAHNWICHRNGEECPDGCDGRGDSIRIALYESIQVK